MFVKAIRTRVLQPPKDDLYSVIGESVKEVAEESILVVTSKIVAIHQGRCVLRSDAVDKVELICEEAEKYLPRRHQPTRRLMLTMKDKMLIPASGIDVSNGNGYYILWPENVQQITKEIHNFIRKEYSAEKIGVIVIDSHTIPLRWGVVGISLSSYGFCPLNDYRKKRDLFGRKSLSLVFLNVVDSIAAAADVVMGEGNEQTPLALVTDIPFVAFGECAKGIPTIEVDPREDLYAPLLRGLRWKKGGKG